jgi:hypothetical protein
MNLIGQKYFEIGVCIYCGKASSQLTKEHVIPFGLGGNAIILKKACCEECRRITSKCEQNPIHNNWAEVRAALGFPSRKRNLAEENFPLDVILEDGSEAKLDLKGRETLGLVLFLEYETPAFFSQKEYRSGIIVNGVKLIGFGVNVEDFKKINKIKGFNLTTASSGNDFAKMIAKMAYCLTIACWGLDCFDERYILPTILNKRDDVGYWMGSNRDGKITPLIGKQPGGFAIRLGIVTSDSGKRNAIVSLKFFPSSEAPEYIVVVGSLRADFNPAQ